jgi:hypothetical protein
LPRVQPSAEPRSEIAPLQQNHAIALPRRGRLASESLPPVRPLARPCPPEARP